MLQDFIVALFLFPILSIVSGYYAFIYWFRVEQVHKILDDRSNWYKLFLGSFSVEFLKLLKSGTNLWLARIIVTFFFILTFGMSIAVIASLLIALVR